MFEIAPLYSSHGSMIRVKVGLYVGAESID